MATTKKTTVKKSSPRNVTVKPSTSKRVTAKKSKTAKSSTAALKSFRIYPNPPTFTKFQLSRQTLYWVILVSFIVFAQLWILKLQIEVATLIDAQQSELQNF